MRALVLFSFCQLALVVASAGARGEEGVRGGEVLEGAVVDPSQAVIPGASVRLKCDRGPNDRSTLTDSQGNFRFDGLPAAECELGVSYSGFKPLSRHLRVAGSLRRLRIVLQIASVVEEVSVGTRSTGGEENQDAVRVDRKLLEDLPVFDQDYVAALSAFLDPAAVGSDGVSLVVDGAEANRVLVSPSAIEEVKINQNPYSAEYYRQGRGRIEIVTKQGSPEYHGTLNFLFRDAALNARDPFAPAKAPEQRRIFEGNLSGPLAGVPDTSFLVSFDRREEDLQSIVLAAGPEGEIRENVPTPQRNTDLSARVTHRFGTRQTVWMQYALEDRAATNQGAGGFTLPEAAANSAYHEDDLDVTHQLVVSPQAMNQLFLHFEWNHGSTTSLSPGMRIVVQDAFTGGGAQADQRQTEMDFKLFDILSWSVGKHHLKAGLQAAEWSHRTYTDLTNRQGTFFFSSLADYEQGRPYAFAQQVGNGYIPLFQKILCGFVQDELQLLPNLSVALGARYDYQNLLQGGHFAPRAFAAFSPGQSRRLTLRGGVGVFNDRFPPATFADLLRLDGRHLGSYLVLDPPYPNPGAALAAQPQNLAQFDPAIATPYVIQYSLGAEWQLGAGTSLAATYRGSRGVRMLRSRDINAPGPPFVERPQPDLGRVRQIESAGRQVSDALELTFRGKVGKRFTSLVQYTLSRTDNNTSGVGFYPASSQDPLAEWGPADFDQRHRINLLGSLNLRWIKLGVGLSAASGKPYNLTTGLDDNRDGFLTDRPPGVGRNSLRAPGFADLDLNLTREIHFDRSKKEKGPTATVGLGLFNVFNTFNPATLEGDQSSPFFGQAIAALPPRRVQLSARFGF